MRKNESQQEKEEWLGRGPLEEANRQARKNCEEQRTKP
jgi:hypothetical protein